MQRTYRTKCTGLHILVTFSPTPLPHSVELLVAMMRMGGKYEIIFLRNGAIALGKRILIEFSRWDNSGIDVWDKSKSDDALLFNIVNFVYENNIKSMLPALSFYAR